MRAFVLPALLVASIATACAHSTSNGFPGHGGHGGSSNGGGGGSGGDVGDDSGVPPGSFGDDGGGSPPPGSIADPTTCAEAAANRSYLGCDYWPTTLTNFILVTRGRTKNAISDKRQRHKDARQAYNMRVRVGNRTQ